ncbi:MAG: hypothetical protein MRY83_13525 [Flavobacteriales bacterium]|nr:hypothetical protein [Flavobacteriales bacterium]
MLFKLLSGIIVPILITAATKFMFSPSMALGAGYDKAETIIITTIGGWMGILFFYYLGGWFTDVIIKFFVQLFKRNKKKKFSSKGKRRIITIKRKLGVVGIAFLTPCIISIPIGSVIASKYFRKNRMTIPYLFLSLLLWSMLLTIASEPIVKSLKEYLS